jgi:Coenzyme PQQ synthesis protein D (PqqD)
MCVERSHGSGSGDQSVRPGDPRGHWTEIWDLLLSAQSLADFAAELSAQHRADPEVVAADVRPVLERLAALGVIEPVF